MGFLLNWLLWRKSAKKQEDKNAKIFEELGKNKTIAKLAENDPQMRRALDSLGVKTPPHLSGDAEDERK